MQEQIILDENGAVNFLEMNTLPGMTAIVLSQNLQLPIIFRLKIN